MSFYALVRSIDSALVAVSDTALTPGQGEELVTFASAPAGLATWDATTRTFLIVAPPAPARAPKITKLDFRSRLTASERVALTLARRGLAADGTTPISAMTAAQLEVLAEDLDAANDVDVTDARTIAGVGAVADALVSLGVVDSAQRATRVAALLSPPGSFPSEQRA